MWVLFAGLSWQCGQMSSFSECLIGVFTEEWYSSFVSTISFSDLMVFLTSLEYFQTMSKLRNITLADLGTMKCIYFFWWMQLSYNWVSKICELPIFKYFKASFPFNVMVLKGRRNIKCWIHPTITIQNSLIHTSISLKIN